jgi:hypothetical protein
MKTIQSIGEYAKELGSTKRIIGINWTTFEGFSTEGAASRLLNHPSVKEHRGVYKDRDGTYSVRVR